MVAPPTDPTCTLKMLLKDNNNFIFLSDWFYGWFERKSLAGRSSGRRSYRNPNVIILVTITRSVRLQRNRRDRTDLRLGSRPPSVVSIGSGCRTGNTRSGRRLIESGRPDPKPGQPRSSDSTRPHCLHKLPCLAEFALAFDSDSSFRHRVGSDHKVLVYRVEYGIRDRLTQRGFPPR